MRRQPASGPGRSKLRTSTPRSASASINARVARAVRTSTKFASDGKTSSPGDRGERRGEPRPLALDLGEVRLELARV